MRLPHLDQKIALHWSEAGQLAQAIGEVLYGAGTPRSLPLVLAMGPLERVRHRLSVRAAMEQLHVGLPARRPWRLTLRYDEVAALMLILPLAPLAGLAWGEIQRVSLNLTRYVDFTWST